MRAYVLAVSILFACATVAAAQPIERWPTAEIRSFIGIYIPQGGMRDRFESATTLGVQVAGELSPTLHVVGTGSWTHGRNKYAFSSNRTDIWQYDAGVEANLRRRIGHDLMLRPFAGIGGGGRTYDYRASGFSARTCTAAYGALGTELQTSEIALRFEAREYMSCFESPTNGRKSTRNDVGMSLGLAYHFR